MNQQEFMRRLKASLKGVSEEAMADILYDYEEHFDIGKQRGKTEEEISDALGLPEQIASQYRLDQAIKKAEEAPRASNVLAAIFVGMGLGFFNLVFVLGIWLLLFGVLVGLLAASIGVFVAGLVVLAKACVPCALPWVQAPFVFDLVTGRLAGVFAGIGVGAMGLLLLMLTIWLTEMVYRGTIAYIKTNIRIIQKASEE